jgi:hypothetical protein
VDFGLDCSDPFGVGALFLAEAMASRFDCQEQVQDLFADLLAIETPRLPNDPIEVVLAPIDNLLDHLEVEPAFLELVAAVLRLGCHSPPRTEQAEQLYRAAMWTMMRHDPAATTPIVLQIMREATPATKPLHPGWPRHEFFSSILVLLYLGGPQARHELMDLLAAARDLGYHDLAPVLDWYLDHSHSAPTR